MAEPLSSETIARLRQRAGNAERRSDASEMSSGSITTDEMLASMPTSSDPAVREYLEGMNTPFAGMISNLATGDGRRARGFLGAIAGMLGGRSMFMSVGGQTVSLGRKRRPTKAPAAASEKQVASAEAELGFALPTPLRQFYLEVADGGVGPGDGLFSLKQLRAKWREMTREPVGPRGQKWPLRLLPIEGEDWDLMCLDRDSGKLIAFDIEEVDYGGWKQCFQEKAEGLEAWLAAWLVRPSEADKAERRAERQAPRQLTDEDWDIWASESPENAEYVRRLEVATMTPAQRAAIGLTEDNWAEKMFDGLDLAKLKMPTPGYADRRRSGEDG